MPGTRPVPGIPPAPPSNNGLAQRFRILNLVVRYSYAHTSLPSAEHFTSDAHAQDSQHDTDSDPDMLTDEGTSTG